MLDRAWPAPSVLNLAQPLCPVPVPFPAGKTVLLELAILRMLCRHIAPDGRFAHQPGHLKAIYLAPSRALVQASALPGLPRAAHGMVLPFGLLRSCLALTTCSTNNTILALPAWLQEKVRDWTERFAPLGITCRELTGGAGSWVLLPLQRPVCSRSAGILSVHQASQAAAPQPPNPKAPPSRRH